jgi:hypothetical protein
MSVSEPETSYFPREYGPMRAIFACNAYGYMDKPELPRVQAEEPQRAVGDRQKHATYSISFESYLLNTGNLSRDAKTDGT